MKKMIITATETYMSTRKTWGNFNPTTKAFKSKKDYNRKDKSWKKEIF